MRFASFLVPSFVSWPLAGAAFTLSACAALTACTETPDSFPPCVENAPCPTSDAGAEASPSPDASDTGAADAVEAP